MDYDDFVDPDDRETVIHLTSNAIEDDIRRCLETLNSTLDDLGLQVSTGRVVDFRAKEYLTDPQQDRIAP
jgi:adenine-specific DNA-methyltransferase